MYRRFNVLPKPTNDVNTQRVAIDTPSNSAQLMLKDFLKWRLNTATFDIKTGKK